MQCTVTWSPETGGGLVKPYPQHISGYGGRPVWKDKSMDDEARRERRRRQRQQVVGCCKKFAAFLFSHIGLAAMVVAYSIMGGFLFQALEAPHEVREKNRIRGQQDDAIQKILNEASQMKLDDEDVIVNFTGKMRTILKEYQEEVVSAVRDSGWDGNEDTGELALQWSFAGALLYAVTVITTIGYGHVAPKTEWGRLVTILYALIGIPLTFLYLSNIGNFLANSFRLFYKKVCCDICCCQQCERKKKLQRLRLRRQRDHLAAQRNISLSDGPNAMHYGAQDDSIPISTATKNDYYMEETLGLPGGDENLAFEDDTYDVELGARSNSHDNLVNYRKAHENDDIRETDILDDDFIKFGFRDIRETDILDDDVDDDVPSRKPSKKKKSSNDLHVSSGILDKLDGARETDILDDSDGEDDQEEDGQNIKEDGPVQKHKNSIKRSKSLKEQSKKDKKESKKDKKDKKARRNSADGIKELSRKPSKKDKSKSNKKDKEISNDTDLNIEENKKGTKGHATEEELPAYSSHSRSDSKKRKWGVLERGKSTKESKKLSRKGTKSKSKDDADTSATPPEPSLSRKSSTRRKGSTSNSDEEDNMKRKSFHHSEDSFVTAQGDSQSYVDKFSSDENSDEEYDDDDEGFHSGKIAKSALAPDVTIDDDDDDDYAMELMEYGDLGPDHARFADDPFEFEGHSDDEKVTVPISICLIIIAGYIFAGAVLFAVWEDWDYLTGSYFCFITLSTIGFGDIVPGTDMAHWSSHSKLVSCSLWLAFGLSLLAMCFNLMQEEVKEKCKWLGKKLGLLKDDNEA